MEKEGKRGEKKRKKQGLKGKRGLKERTGARKEETEEGREEVFVWYRPMHYSEPTLVLLFNFVGL